MKKWMTVLLALAAVWTTVAGEVIFDGQWEALKGWRKSAEVTLTDGRPQFADDSGKASLQRAFAAKPGEWYRATVKVEALPGKRFNAAALQLRALPYPLKTYGESAYLHFSRIKPDGTCELTMQLPADARELLVLIYTYPDSNQGFAVASLRLESFTPPAHELTAAERMAKLGKYALAPRDLCLETALVRDGKPAAAIVGDPAPAARLNAAIKRKTGIELPVLPGDSYREKTGFDRNLVMLGNRHDNASVNSLYLRHYTLLDVKYPGRGGSVVRSLHNPYGDKNNVIFAGGSDSAGTAAACDKLAALIEARPSGKDLTLGHLAEIKLGDGVEVPQDVKDMAIYERSRGYGDVGYFGWNSLAKNLAAFYMTGEPRFAKEFLRLAFPKDQATRDELFKRDGEAYRDRSDPIVRIYHYCGAMMILYWDLVEESPVWTPEERELVTQAFYRQLTRFLTEDDYTNPYRNYDQAQPRNPDRHYTWQMLTAGIAARYFAKYYPDCGDAAEALRMTGNAMEPMMTTLLAENISRFWYNTAIELPAEYALLFHGEKYVGDPLMKRYPRALVMLSGLDSYDWSQVYSSRVMLRKWAYLAQDEALMELDRRIGLDDGKFMLGQSFYPDKPYPANSLVEDAGRWQIHRVDPVGLKLRGILPPFPVEKAVNWMSFRTKGDGSGDFLLLDTQYNLGLRSPLHQFSLLSAHLNGFPVLRGFFNSLENYADGLCDPNIVFFSEVLNYGKAGDIAYVTGLVRDRNGMDWQRTWLLREGKFLLAVDTATLKRDMKLAEVANYLTGITGAKVEMLANGEFQLRTRRGAKTFADLQNPAVGESADFVVSCSADAEPDLVPVSSDAQSSSTGMLFALRRPDGKAGDRIQLATLIRPGRADGRFNSAQQGDLVALRLPEPAELKFQPDGFQLALADGTFTLAGDRAGFVPGGAPDAAKLETMLAARTAPAKFAAAPATLPAPLWQRKFAAPVGVMIKLADGFALAAGKSVYILDGKGKTKVEIPVGAEIGALAWEPTRQQLIVGCGDEKVLAFGLDGKRRWEYTSVMHPEVAKLGPYWHKSAVPGIRSLACTSLGGAAIFAGSAGNVEALTAEGKLVKNIYLQFGAVDSILRAGDRLLFPHASGGSPVIHAVNAKLEAETLPCFGGTVESNLGQYGFSSVGHAFLLPLPDGGWLDLFNGMHNRLVRRDREMKPIAEANFGPGAVARCRIYGMPDAPPFNLRGAAVAGPDRFLVATNRKLLFVFDGKLQVREVIRLEAIPAFLVGLPGGDALLALENGALGRIRDGKLDWCARVGGKPLTALATPEGFAVGTDRGEVAVFR